MISEKRLLSVSLCIILILVAVAYGGSLRNGFVWDDETFIVNNKFVHDLARWPQYFTTPESVSDDHILSRMYRPIQTLSFALDAALWGKRAGGFHLTSLLLHILSCGAIVFSFRTLVGFKPALLAAFVFAIHPALSEGVLSLASRGNQLYTVFALFSLGLFVRVARPFDISHILSIIMAALALFSKEPAIALVALLPLIHAAFKQPWGIRDKRSIFLYAPYIAAAVIYLIMRSYVVDTTSAVSYWGGSLPATFQMQAKVFLIYLRLLVWPFELKGRYTITHPGPFPDLLVTGAVLLNIALVISGIILYRKSNNGKILSVAVAWFYISLAPVANLIPLPGSMMGERFLYFTFAGIMPLLFGAVQWKEWEKSKPLIVILGVALSSAWLITDIKRTPEWKDNAAFFTLLSRQQPDDPAVQIRMAQVELEMNNAASALNRLERLMRREPGIPTSHERSILHYWHGRALLDLNRPGEAYREFSIVRNLWPQSSRDVALLVAEALARSGDLATARLTLEEEIKESPENDALWNGLGNISVMMGNIPDAVDHYRHALELNPANKEAATNLQNALSRSPSNTRQNIR